MPDDEVRMAALVAGLSVASDLGKGLDDGQGLRATVLSMRLAERLGLSPADRATLYWVGLLRFVGCTATASEMAAALGDELALSAAFAAIDARDLRSVFRGAVATVGTRPDRLLAFLAKAPAVIREHENASCEVAQAIAGRLGLGPDVTAALGQVFERWDGSGHPGRARGADLSLAVRTWQVAHLADLLLAGGAAPDEVCAALRARSGTALDPDVVAACTDPDLFAEPTVADVAVVLAAEPQPWHLAADDRLDDVLAVFGLVADLKAPFFLGHSTRTSALAARAAELSGRTDTDVRLVRRAALVQDVGRVAVSSRIWTASAPLSEGEREQVRLHPYHSGRVLARVPALAAIAELAVAHHERGDGSGYHRGLVASASPPMSGLLGAADAYVTALSPRPHRAAGSPAQAAALLHGEVAAGRLGADAVDAVLAATGTAAARPRTTASNALTDRERQVLDTVAAGLTNRAAGRRLGISPKTVNTHLEHAYAKLGVSTRAAAIVVAVQRGWLDVGSLSR